MAPQQGGQHPLDEHRLAIEDVDLGVGDLAVDQQRHADALEGLKHRGDGADRAHAGIRVGGGASRVQLDGGQHALAVAQLQIGRVAGFGQIGRHQRRESCLRGPVSALAHCRQDPIAVGPCVRGGGDRGAQVGHHDGAGELPRRGRGHHLQQRTVAQVHVPVIRLANRQAVHPTGVDHSSLASGTRSRSSPSRPRLSTSSVAMSGSTASSRHCSPSCSPWAASTLQPR